MGVKDSDLLQEREESFFSSHTTLGSLPSPSLCLLPCLPNDLSLVGTVMSQCPPAPHCTLEPSLCHPCGDTVDVCKLCSVLWPQDLSLPLVITVVTVTRESSLCGV